MIGIYLLVSIFAQFSPTAGWFTPTTAVPTVSAAISVTVSFDQLNGVKLGTPVLSDGRRIGAVTKIKGPIDSGSRAAARYQVEVSVTQSFGLSLHRGTVALQTAPMSVSRMKPVTVVELMFLPGENPAELARGEPIAGFSSLEKFWSAGIRRRI